MRDNPVVVSGRSNDTIAAPFRVMRCPEGGPLFASSRRLLHTGCSLETLDIKYTREFLAGDTVGLFGAVFIGGALRGGMQALQLETARAAGASQVAAGISSVGNQAVQQRLGRALDTRPTIEVDSGQLCQVLLTKPVHLPAIWQ